MHVDQKWASDYHNMIFFFPPSLVPPVSLMEGWRNKNRGKIHIEATIGNRLEPGKVLTVGTLNVLQPLLWSKQAPSNHPDSIPPAYVHVPSHIFMVGVRYMVGMLKECFLVSNKAVRYRQSLTNSLQLQPNTSTTNTHTCTQFARVCVCVCAHTNAWHLEQQI